MAQYTTDGIVIGGSKFGEADRILRILTKERGRVSAMAKGVRRGKSKFSGCLEPMMVNAFLFAEGRNMDTVCQAENIRSYSRIRSSYDLLCRAGSLLEAAGQLTEEGLPDLMTYELLLGALDALDAGSSPAIVELIFKTGLLLGHGIFPDLSGCNTCGKTRTKAIHFDGARMSFICDDCAKTQGIYHPIPHKTLEGLHWASGCGVDTEKEISGIFIETNPPSSVMDNVDDAVKLADEMLSAFLQKGFGKFRKHNNSTGNT
jgi:DNA repair protein RecO (recombination protein O)